MDRAGGELSRVAFRPAVRDEIDGPAARGELERQRLGREEMAAGAAGGQEDGPRSIYSAGAGRWLACGTPICVRFSGRLRVSASTMPIEIAMAINDEPP